MPTDSHEPVDTDTEAPSTVSAVSHSAGCVRHPGPADDGRSLTLSEVAEIERRRDIDPDELVGPGAYGLRVQPAAALIPGRSDSARLTAVWFVRKSFYWMFFLGWAVASWIAYGNGDAINAELNLTSLDSAGEGLGTPGMALLVAIGVRFINSWVALALAYPLAIAHETDLSPRENLGSGIGRFFDRLHVTRAFRSLRWTHHVRQIALQRLGPTGRRVGRLDPILDVVNIVSCVGAFVLVGSLAAQSGT